MGKDTLRRWGPVLGAGVLVVATVLRIFGNGEVAQTVEAIGATVGVTQQSPVPGPELAAGATQLIAALVAAWGIGRKLKASLPKPGDSVKPRSTWVPCVLLALLVLPGCASGQFRVGSEPKPPGIDLDTVVDRLCYGGTSPADKVKAAEVYIEQRGGKSADQAEYIARARRKPCPCPAEGACTLAPAATTPSPSPSN